MKGAEFSKPSLSVITRVLLLTAVYFVGGILGKEASFLAGSVQLVWPPAGIALAALLLFGYRYWPGVALGALVFSLLNALPLGVFTLGVVVGNTVGALLCTYLLDRFVRFHSSLGRVRDVAGFVGLACVLGTTVNSMFNVVSLAYVGDVSWNDLFPSMLEWWVPNAMAGLVVAPFLLAWGTPSRAEWQPYRVVEAAVCGIGLTIGTLISFNSWYAYGIQNYPLSLLPYPFLVWASLRFGQRGATTGSLLVSALAIYSLLQGRGPFVTSTEKESLMLVGSYIGILAVTNLMLAAAANERDTAETAARKSEEMATLISRNVSDLIYVTDVAGKRLYLSPSYKRVLGHADKLLGTEAFAEVHPDDRERVRQAFEETVKTQQDQRLEFRLLLPDGAIRFIESQDNFVRGELGQPDRVVSIGRDITERKQFEEDLARARDAALVSARLKAEFLANMSHEIRTPLNGIVGMTNLLLRTKLTAQQRDYAESVRTSTDALLTIINDILDFSKIEAGKLTFEVLDFDLNETLENALGIQAQSAAAKRIELTGFVQPTVTTQLRGDPGRLGQVLNNLLSNAVKFTHKGEVGIRVTQESETKTHVTLRLEVKDSGIGIPPEAQGRLFQAFIQADGSTTRRYGGTGLGLVICRQLVNMMNGQIGLRSALGQGSTFWFLVPFEKQPISPKPEKAEGVQLSKVRVLAVDDNETNRQVLHHQLEGWRMRNDCVGSGPEALAKLREAQTTDPYGLAILDLQMPEMDGLTLAREIKADPAIAKTALIMLTSMDQQLEPDIMASVGISACLMKPVRQSRLLDVLVNVVSQGGLPVSLVGVLGVAKPGVARSLPPRDTRILLAEDNIINQKVALGQLEELGYRADVAANGREVLEALDRQDYDIILMDCQMPEMDGYEATRQIRSREQELARSGRKKPALHIIAMTAHAMHGDREKCLQAGMNDYISKPVDDEELQTALSRWQPPAKPETPPVKPEAPPATPTLPPSGVTPPVGAATSAVGGAGVAEAPPVNFKRLNRVALGDKAKVRELVELYLTQAEQLMKRIEAGLQAGSAKEVEQAAHKLCGSSASCGIESVVAPLRELERMGREGHLGEATPKFAEAVRQMERARHSLGQHLESVS